METKVIKALLQCPLFEGLTADEIEQVMSAVNYRLVRFDMNDVYVLAGSPCRYADIIVEGKMTARMVGPSGKFVQMAARNVGDLLAPAFIFSKNNKMPVSIETCKATTILRMSPDDLRQLMKCDERIQMNFIQQLSSVSQFLAKKVRILTLHTVREKVAIFLLEESKKCNSDHIVLTKSRQEIADSFAIQKFSLQRCLNELAAEGAILLDGKQITIVDKQKLNV
jgi:CRP-like cAMP-binding protein